MTTETLKETCHKSLSKTKQEILYRDNFSNYLSDFTLKILEKLSKKKLLVI